MTSKTLGEQVAKALQRRLEVVLGDISKTVQTKTLVEAVVELEEQLESPASSSLGFNSGAGQSSMLTFQQMTRSAPLKKQAEKQTQSKEKKEKILANAKRAARKAALSKLKSKLND